MSGLFSPQLVACFRRERSSLTALLLDNSDVVMKLNDSLCVKQLIVTNHLVVLDKSASPQEITDSLIGAINESIISSPGYSWNILEEMKKYDCLKEWAQSVRKQEITETAKHRLCKDVAQKLEVIKKGRAAMDKQIEEVMKNAYGDHPVPTEPLTTPQRFPNVTTSTTEDLIEWLRMEFEYLENETIRIRTERREKDLRRLKEGLDEILEEMTRKEEKLDQDIAECKRIAEATAKEFKERISAKNKKLNEDLMKKFEELNKSQKKFNEETLDRYLERERRIDAIEEAIDSGTYEIKKVEKSYKSGLVPEWTHTSLSKVSYKTLPIYRTIRRFKRKKQKNASIFTDSFYTSRGGYKMTLNVRPNGYGEFKGSHVSVFIHLMKGNNDHVLPFPFTGNVIVQALNWSTDSGHVEQIISFDESTVLDGRRKVNDGERSGYGWGDVTFIAHQDLQQYLHNDMICFRVLFEDIKFQGSPVPNWYTDVAEIQSPIPPCIVTMYHYSRLKKTDSPWFSRPFYSSERGYRLQLEVNADGVGLGKGIHVSVGVCLTKGEYDDELQWPLNATITVQLLNWFRDSDHREKTIRHYEAPLKCRTRIRHKDTALEAWSYHFISHVALNDDSNSNIKYTDEDKLCFRIFQVNT